MQDLVDFEMVLEQLKGGTSCSPSYIGGGKPYTELKAVRQMLYWRALEGKTLSPAKVSKGLLSAEGYLGQGFAPIDANSFPVSVCSRSFDFSSSF